MLRHVDRHLFHIRGIGLPDRGNQLAGRVGEKVAVMEIHHEGHPGGFHLPGHFHYVSLAAPASVGVHPDAQAHGIQAHLLHQGGDFLRAVSGRIVIILSACLLSGRPADVGAEPERLRLRARGRHQHRGHQKHLFHAARYEKSHFGELPAARDLFTRRTPPKTSAVASAFCQVKRSMPIAMPSAAAMIGWR